MLALPAPLRVTALLTAFTLMGCPVWAQTLAPEQAETSATQQSKHAQQSNHAQHAKGSVKTAKSPAQPLKTPAQSANAEAKKSKGFTDLIANATAPEARSSAQKSKTATQSAARATPPSVTRVAKTASAKPRTALAVDGPVGSEGVKALVSQYAQMHGVPETLAHRVVLRESRYNPALMGRGHFGLMQISLPTARQMGYAGPPQGLFDARTNLAHGMPYLANAWLVSGGNEARAVSLYSRGYYYDAKRKGLIKALRTARSAPVEPVDAEAVAVAE